MPWWMMQQPMGPSMPINTNPGMGLEYMEKAMDIAKKLERRALKKELRDEEKKKKDKKPDKKFRDFTFWETFGILTIGSMILGPFIAHMQLAYLESLVR